MNTEITVNPANKGFGIVFYDADCAWCRALARRWATLLARHGFRAEPLQTPGTAERLCVAPDQLMARMHLRTADGRIFCGADAFIELARTRPWSRPLALLASVPGVLPILRRGYEWIASRRHCGTGGACAQARNACHGALRSRFLGILPLLTAPVLVILGRNEVPAWLFMWLLAFSLFAGCKWLTLVEAFRRGVSLELRSALAYLLGWVGMEPREFARPRTRSLERESVTPEPGPSTAWFAGARVTLGVVLVWGGARWMAPLSPLAAGWIGMIGLILILHFGLFDLLALAWRRVGYSVKPLMNRPIRAVSVGDFWSTRWNRGFHTLAHRLMYQPLAARLGRPFAVLGVFLGSGLVHDLVISVPARGGYGLPTAYFLLQGLALLFERSRVGRRLHLGRGLPGRLFAIVLVAGPAFWLFPPIFVRNVILPMLQAIGATGNLL